MWYICYFSCPLMASPCVAALLPTVLESSFGGRMEQDADHELVRTLKIYIKSCANSEILVIQESLLLTCSHKDPGYG